MRWRSSFASGSWALLISLGQDLDGAYDEDFRPRYGQSPSLGPTV